MDLDRILDGRDIRWSISDCGLVVREELKKFGKTGKPLKCRRYVRRAAYRTMVTYFSGDGEVLQCWSEIDQWLADHPTSNFAQVRLDGLATCIRSIYEKIRKKIESN